MALSIANTFLQIVELEKDMKAQREAIADLQNSGWEGGVGSVGQGFMEFRKAWEREGKQLPAIYTPADHKKWRLPWSPGAQIFGVVCGNSCRYCGNCGNRTTDVSRKQCKTCAGDLKCQTPSSSMPPLAVLDPSLDAICQPLTTKPLKLFGFNVVTSSY